MKKLLTLIFLCVFCLNAINAGVIWTLSEDGKTLTISGTDMPDYTSPGNVPWKLGKINKVIIENGVTSIGTYAFYDFRGLTSITIPNSVKKIGSNVFESCTGLTSITIPNSVRSIGGYAFKGCSSLTSISIGNSVTTLNAASAFYDCPAITSITVEKGNEMYDSREDCNAIIETESNTLVYGCKNTIIPNSVMSIAGSAFSTCKGLTSITIPNSVTSIGGHAFRDCI